LLSRSLIKHRDDARVPCYLGNTFKERRDESRVSTRISEISILYLPAILIARCNH